MQISSVGIASGSDLAAASGGHLAQSLLAENMARFGIDTASLASKLGELSLSDTLAVMKDLSPVEQGQLLRAMDGAKQSGRPEASAIESSACNPRRVGVDNLPYEVEAPRWIEEFRAKYKKFEAIENLMWDASIKQNREWGMAVWRNNKNPELIQIVTKPGGTNHDVKIDVTPRKGWTLIIVEHTHPRPYVTNAYALTCSPDCYHSEVESGSFMTDG